MREIWPDILHALEGWFDRQPRLLQLLGVHLVLGAALAVVFVSLFVYLNVAGFKDLLHEVDDPFLPLVSLYVLNILTFSSVTMGAAVMLQGGDR